MDRTDFARRRKALGLSPRDVAALAGLTEASVRNLEAGKRQRETTVTKLYATLEAAEARRTSLMQHPDVALVESLVRTLAHKVEKLDGELQRLRTEVRELRRSSTPPERAAPTTPR